MVCRKRYVPNADLAVQTKRTLQRDAVIQMRTVGRVVVVAIGEVSINDVKTHGSVFGQMRYNQDVAVPELLHARKVCRDSRCPKFVRGTGLAYKVLSGEFAKVEVRNLSATPALGYHRSSKNPFDDFISHRPVVPEVVEHQAPSSR